MEFFFNRIVRGYTVLRGDRLEVEATAREPTVALVTAEEKLASKAGDRRAEAVVDHRVSMRRSASGGHICKMSGLAARKDRR